MACMTTSQLLHPLRDASPARSRTRQAPRPTTTTPVAGVEPSWARPALFALLAVTALAYLWDLSASGYANSFYAAAVQAGTRSWKAFFFGSLDSSNFITVDKPPASLWVMAMSGRIFGFSSWSMLVPQALEGVATVALLHAAVKRWFSAGAGLLAGAIFALTPVAALMFRFNNPDALLVLLMVAGAYCLTRALEGASTRWIVAAGSMIGLAFLAKMLQAFLVLPAFALVYMVAAPTTLRRRAWQTLAGGLAVLVSAGWWVAIVALWPAGSRPMIDGSPDNSILNLIFGYNGFGRIFAGSGGPGGGGGANFSGPTGLLRLFNDLMGGQASWLLPAALIALAVGLWARRGTPRTDRTRAALMLWGGWLLVTAAIFSLSQGVIHTYYTVALAPAIGALVAIGARQAYDRRDMLLVRALAATAIAASAVWAFVLLDRTPRWLPWLRVAILLAGGLSIVCLLAARHLSGLLAAGVAFGAVASLAGPLAYAADTVTTPHTGSIPSAGPASASAFGGGPGGARGGFPGATGGGFPGAGGAAGTGAEGSAGAGAGGSASGPALFGSSGSSGSARPGGESGAGRESGTGASAPGGTSAPGAGGSSSGFPGAVGGAGRAAGGPGGSVSVNAKLAAALKKDAGSYRWVAATSGSQSAASLELASGGEPVMGIGGFSNEGGRLSLAAFERYVKAGDIHYYVSSGGGAGGPGGAGSTQSIASWVEAHFKAVTIGGETVYDLTQEKQ
jgi:4-amino-4-deoxy-L-arabinose transferase-like glycosyltransferase